MSEKKMTAEELRRYMEDRNAVNVEGLLKLHPPKGKKQDEKKKPGKKK